jgi:hypothetical protein
MQILKNTGEYFLVINMNKSYLFALALPFLQPFNSEIVQRGLESRIVRGCFYSEKGGYVLEGFRKEDNFNLKTGGPYDHPAKMYDAFSVMSDGSLIISWSTEREDSLDAQLLRLIGDYVQEEKITNCTFPVERERLTVGPNKTIVWSFKTPDRGISVAILDSERTYKFRFDYPLADEEKSRNFLVKISRSFKYNPQRSSSLREQGMDPEFATRE